MVAALRACKAAGLKVGCITNNVGDLGPDAVSPERAAQWREVAALFDVMVESSRAGVRKPEPAIYRMACELLGISPAEAVYLDDLGINLKPAKALGMQTIKVEDPRVALEELARLTGLSLR
jgi:putative hydrolase of the HAD superfamily